MGKPRVRLVSAAGPAVTPLRERAAKLWPESTSLQARWIKAVHIVRQTSKGWLLDRPMEKT